MGKNKLKLKKIILLVSVIIVIVIAAVAYNFFSWFIPKKTDMDVSHMTSSDSMSDIFINSETDGTDNGFNELITLMDNEDLHFYKTSEIDGMIAEDDVIILKINSQWDQRGGTNVDLVKSVIDAILNHPNNFNGEIVIADNGQGQFGTNNNGGRMDWDMANGVDRSFSMQDLADTYINAKVSAYSWDKITKIEVDEFSDGDMIEGFVLYDQVDDETKITVSYPKFVTEFGTSISFKYGIWDENQEVYDSDRLKVINMPVLKSHMTYGVTGAMKSYMGVPSDKLTRNAHPTIGIGSMGTMMVETRMPVLNIVDAIYVNAHTDRSTRGPSTNYEDATFTHTVLVSTDPVALDYYAAGTILYPEMEANGDELELKHQRDSREVGSLGYWLTLSMNELHQGGYDCVIDENNMNIYYVDSRK